MYTMYCISYSIYHLLFTMYSIPYTIYHIQNLGFLFLWPLGPPWSSVEGPSRQGLREDGTSVARWGGSLQAAAIRGPNSLGYGFCVAYYTVQHTWDMVLAHDTVHHTWYMVPECMAILSITHRIWFLSTLLCCPSKLHGT